MKMSLAVFVLALSVLATTAASDSISETRSLLKTLLELSRRNGEKTESISKRGEGYGTATCHAPNWYWWKRSFTGYNSGTIESYQYGRGEYGDNTQCEWAICVKQGMVVRLTFEGSFWVEGSGGSCWDKLRIGNGDQKNSPVNSIICGSNRPSVVTSSSNCMNVYFTTDRDTHGTGFRAKWKAVQKSAPVPSPTPAPPATPAPVVPGPSGNNGGNNGGNNNGQTNQQLTAEQQEILTAHNTFRSGVTPTATDMQKMYWNDNLAASAQAWVDQCVWAHDPSWDRRVNSDIKAAVGQNLYGGTGSRTWTEAVTSWYDEVNDYTYPTGSHNGKVVGHYTQVVWSKSAVVGCAKATCGSWTHYYCNYAYGNNGGETIYSNGASCSACPGKCENNLCDCQGKFCAGGGTLDLATCTCSCKDGWSGDSCEICPGSDTNWGCQQGRWAWGKCEVYSNVPDSCPNMCGICN